MDLWPDNVVLAREPEGYQFSLSEKSSELPYKVRHMVLIHFLCAVKLCPFVQS